MQNQEKNPKPTVDVTVYYHKQMKLESKTRTLEEVLELVWNSPGFENHSPLKLIFNGTQKVLYMDENMCQSFLKKKITLADFIQGTQCDELYRNKKEIITDEDFTIEKGHLFKLKKEELILIDDDIYYDATLDLKVFEIAE